MPHWFTRDTERIPPRVTSIVVETILEGKVWRVELIPLVSVTVTCDGTVIEATWDRQVLSETWSDSPHIPHELTVALRGAIRSAEAMS
jgi:hypothetical protein